MSSIPNNLCSIPWTGFSNEPDGRAQPCCLYKGYIEQDSKPLYVQTHSPIEILTSDYMKKLREQFRNNEKPTGCSTCWRDEESGYQSKRVVYNNIHKDWNIDYNQEPVDVSEFQLIISNSCNLKCRSCTPSHSSQWQHEMRAITGDSGYPMPHGQSANDTSKLWTERHEWYKSLKRLEVVGGEPFYVKQWHTIFNELIDMGYSKNIDITMTTNCTLFYPELLHKMSLNFKSVSIGLSIDGIGSTYEYIRHPGKWDVTYENMKKYHKLSNLINLQLNLTISWLNAHQVPDIHELVKNEFPKFTIWNNLVHYPMHLPIWATTDEFKDSIETTYKNYDWDTKYISTIDSIIKYMRSQTVTKTEFINNLQVLYKTDKFRNENLIKSIPILERFVL